MAERDLLINTPDKKTIHGTFLTPSGRPEGLVILVHGLGGLDYWPPLLAASKYFQKRGYAVYRINLYSSWMKNARKFLDSTLTQHSRDLDTVVQYFRRKGHRSIFAAGHSFGGLTLLRSDTFQFKAVSMWDISSPRTYPIRRWGKYNPKIKKYIMGGNTDFLMSEKYMKDFDKFPDELVTISKMGCPTQICYAAGKKAMLVSSSKDYFKALDVQKELVPISKASHCFLEEDCDLRLFKATEKWYRKFL